MVIDPAITSALIAARAWAWSGIGKPLADKLRGEAGEKAAQFGWDDAAKAYAQGLHREVSTMRIFGASGEVPLDDVFTDVNILEDVVARRRHDIGRLREQEFDRFDVHLDGGRIRRVNGLDLVKGGGNLFILGQPGAGKTTFLKYVATRALLGEVARTPIFVSLKEWSTSRHDRLEPFIADRFAVCNFPQAAEFIDALLRAGKALVLFDGLDEVNLEGGRRRALITLLDNFAQQHKRQPLPDHLPHRGQRLCVSRLSRCGDGPFRARPDPRVFAQVVWTRRDGRCGRRG
ncbi:MAG: NACHT domain-containing protein [Caldilineaceae bacterium]|nr:NACHT domain-containing protein [Caldilineaceae bacterium]